MEIMIAGLPVTLPGPRARPTAARCTRRLVPCTASLRGPDQEALRHVSLQLVKGLAAAALVLQPLAAAGPPHAAAEQAAPAPTAGAAGGKRLFDPDAYAGRWYEVASLKKGFAGEGQGDCHGTQGIYVPQMDGSGSIKLQVNTFCVHGGPGGRLSGIQGSVSCANPVLLELLPEFETELERAEGIVEKCVLRFDSLPFLPPEPYNVIRTDYTSYALVQGAKDRSFVQIYSRTPRPGPEFIANLKAQLAELGYPADEIKDTPQDLDEVPPQQLMAVMNAGMAATPLMPASTPPPVAMAGYDLGPMKGITFDAVRNPLETVRDVLRLLQP